MSNTKRISITLPAATEDALKQIAHDDWITISGTVARLVNEEQIRREKIRKEKGSRKEKRSVKGFPCVLP